MKPLPPLLIAFFLFTTVTIVYAQERRLFMPNEIELLEDGICKGLKLHDYWGDWTAQKQ